MHDLPGRDAIIIQVLKQHYHAKFGIHLEQGIESCASGDHKKLLLAYASMPRYEGREVDREMVVKDAKALYKAGEKKWGTDEKTFISIFSERSAAHLAAVDSAYHDMYGNSLKKVIKKETSGLFLHALKTILLCSANPAEYFAKDLPDVIIYLELTDKSYLFTKKLQVLHKAMKGMGTNDTALIRVIVTRTEIDMQYIKAEYLKRYRKTLNDAVHSETSGHYRAFLLALLGPNQ
ncbi:ANNEXIN [Salix purpurea]|uniref:Annexin n=1 Tax=Salix purpurea TaxID=77065 RepID=A0A9Q0W3R8_SALPP|nr:ANNEXIN [Salix purpurea]